MLGSSARLELGCPIRLDRLAHFGQSRLRQRILPVDLLL
jgi:hypothetical protein